MSESTQKKSSEVYETPDVVEDDLIDPIPLTQPQTLADSPIITTTLDATSSFKKFEGSRLDSRGKDFSDSIGKKSSLESRNRYEIINRSLPEGKKDIEILETPMQRYERLRLEINNFLSDLENIRTLRSKASEPSESSENPSISSSLDYLTDDLDNINIMELADRLKQWQLQLHQASKKDGGLDLLTSGSQESSVLRLTMQTDLTSRLLNKISLLTQSENSESASLPSQSLQYELYYNKETGNHSKLSHIADLERRISTIEQIVAGTVSPDLPVVPNSKGIVQIVEDVRMKVNAMDERAIDQLAHRMAKISANFENLKATKMQISPLTEEQDTKINNLYASINKIDTVASELPIVVDRMVQLRALHEKAVQFSTQLQNFSTGQSEIGAVLRANLAAINKMQESLNANMTTIEKNVLALEKRIADVSTLLSK